MKDAALQELQRAHSWPKKLPELQPVNWGLDAGGKQLITEQIRDNDVSIVLEIGVFLGASSRVWLDASPNVVVIALDPWEGGDWVGDFARTRRQPDWVADQLGRDEEAFYETFLVNMWGYRKRLIPVRGWALDKLPEIADFGVQPHLIYLDADKLGRELEVCHELFPQAILTGDDWFFGTDRLWQPDEGYPIRKPVMDFCQKHHRHLIVDQASWVISEKRLSIKDQLVRAPKYRMKSMRRRARAAIRHLLGSNKAA